MKRRGYDGVVLCAPISVPYRRYSTNSAHWWIGRALHALTQRTGLKPTDIDGLSVSSFTLAPDTTIVLAQHLGLSPRWLDHVPLGGAGGGVALRRGARAVQAGDADFVACIGVDTNHVDSFRKTLSSFSRFAQDAVYPYGSGGPNASFALITRHYMNRTGATREDFGRICVAQRANAQRYDIALMRKPLTIEEYMNARPISDPIHLFDCVMPCAGAEAFLICREDDAHAMNIPFVRVLSAIERHNTYQDAPIQYRGGWAVDRDDLWGMAGIKPDAVDFLQSYDDYPVMVMMQIEDLGFCAKGEAPAFVRAHTLTTDGDFPHNTCGGQLSVGQAGAGGGHLARLPKPRLPARSMRSLRI